MVDKVYEDSMARFDYSRRLAFELIQRLFLSIAARADTQGEVVPVLVFNTK
jgi:hypothetical protein